MAFGKHESYNENYIEYKESVDMLLSDLMYSGYDTLTKKELMNLLTNNMSIGRAVRQEVIKILNELPKEG